MMDYKEDCLMCVYLNINGKCGNIYSVMYNISTNEREAQICNDRRYYNRDTYKKNKKKRKIESIYDYE